MTDATPTPDPLDTIRNLVEAGKTVSPVNEDALYWLLRFGQKSSGDWNGSPDESSAGFFAAAANARPAISALVEELEQLREVVKGLPRTMDGETKKDGDRVFFFNEWNKAIEEVFIEYGGHIAVLVDPECNGWDRGDFIGLGRCVSTREVAVLCIQLEEDSWTPISTPPPQDGTYWGKYPNMQGTSVFKGGNWINERSPISHWRYYGWTIERALAKHMKKEGAKDAE